MNYIDTFIKWVSKLLKLSGLTIINKYFIFIVIVILLIIFNYMNQFKCVKEYVEINPQQNLFIIFIM